MNSKLFALYGGFLMLFLGVSALIPGLEGSAANLPDLKVETSYGLFLGLLPINIFNKMALIVFGIWGIASSRQNLMNYSVNYSKVVFFVMGTLAILGVFPQTNTLGGLWPLFGGEVIAHGLFAIIGGTCALADTKGHRPTIHYS